MSEVFRHDSVGTPAHAWTRSPHWGRGDPVDLSGFRRLVVLAAHPDDETLGCGGAIAVAAAHGLDITVVLSTAGEASHPNSPTHDAAALAERRLAEDARALEVLADGARREFLGLPDGQLERFIDRIAAGLVDLIGDGDDTLLLSPWASDGHPDHEACGRAAMVAARRTDARPLQFPIWWRHWADPGLEKDRIASARWVRLPLRTQEAKRRAIDEHRSQVRPLSGEAGDEVLLTADVLQHFTQPVEIFFDVDAEDPALDHLHARDPDPWQVESSHYERRKRGLTLASLPSERYHRALEVGCSRGALAAALAGRCDQVVGMDDSRHAVELARTRLAGHSNVSVVRASAPEQWLEGRFDLVVVSEVGYFLGPSRLLRLWDRIAASLTRDGTLLLCHWLGPMDGWVLDGDMVHRSAVAHPALPPVQGRYHEHNFEIVVMAPDDVWPTVP